VVTVVCRLDWLVKKRRNVVIGQKGQIDFGQFVKSEILKQFSAILSLKQGQQRRKQLDSLLENLCPKRKKQALLRLAECAECKRSVPLCTP
jgi:hypothetical protein